MARGRGLVCAVSGASATWIPCNQTFVRTSDQRSALGAGVCSKVQPSARCGADVWKYLANVSKPRLGSGPVVWTSQARSPVAVAAGVCACTGLLDGRRLACLLLHMIRWPRHCGFHSCAWERFCVVRMSAPPFVLEFRFNVGFPQVWSTGGSGPHSRRAQGCPPILCLSGVVTTLVSRPGLLQPRRLCPVCAQCARLRPRPRSQSRPLGPCDCLLSARMDPCRCAPKSTPRTRTGDLSLSSPAPSPLS